MIHTDKNNPGSSARLDNLLRRREASGSLGAIDYLIQKELQTIKSSQLECNFEEKPEITFEPFFSKPIDLEDAWEEKYSKRPKILPPEIQVKEPIGLGNDYRHLIYESQNGGLSALPCVSICILTYNRAKYLARTLAALVMQDYDINKLEVVVSDDGSSGAETLNVCREFSDKLNLKYIWHPDSGFRAAQARNNAIATTSHDTIILLDVDMLPGKNLVKSYSEYYKILCQSILIGPRKYVKASHLASSDILNSSNYEELLLSTNTDNAVAGFIRDGKSIDWRIPVFEKTDNLIHEPVPFRVFASGNVCFSKTIFENVGRFDENFISWGYEDTELGFRFYNNGKYFIPVLDALAFHQEPPNGKNETNREVGKKISGELFGSLCPYYRDLTSKDIENYKVPTVSIYIPAYNCEDTICQAIDSALRQTYKDLEVCVCDDGSTDQTLNRIKKYYSNNSKVKILSQENGGIGAASNTAVKMCSGLYIGQLDSDDILADDAVEICIEKFKSDPKIGLVYTSYYNWDESTNELTDGYNYPVFTREKALTAMIIHHFRMFRRKDWCRTTGFNEKIKNAVDYDMYLKLLEKTNVVHINRRAYVRRLHGKNTSIINHSDQMLNTSAAVNASLQRQRISYKAKLKKSDSPELLFSSIDKS